jgi:hypothetical protein
MRVIGASARMAAWSRRALKSGRLVGVLVAVPLVVAAPRVAAAGGANYGIALASSVVQRYYPDSSTNAYPFRAASLNPNDINFQDCEDNIHLVFNLLETGGSTGDAPDILQVWAGTTDCTQTTARSGAESPFCWQVAGGQQFIVNGTFDIYARSLTRYIDSTLDAVANNGSPVSGSGLPESACRTQSALGQVGLSLYFMFVPSTGDATPDASLAYALNVSLLGPPAPTNVLVAEAGNASLAIDWSPPVDPDVEGFRVFVVDNGPAGTTSGDAAADACASSVFVDTWTRNVSLPSNGGTVAAGISEVASKYLAGTIGGSTAATLDVTAFPGDTPLVPGHRYAVAVAAYDEDGNTGLLSTVGCEIAVADPGGSGASGGGTGAGGCALGRVGSPTTGSVLGLTFGSALAGLARRRRRSRAG